MYKDSENIWEAVARKCKAKGNRRVSSKEVWEGEGRWAADCYHPVIDTYLPHPQWSICIQFCFDLAFVWPSSSGIFPLVSGEILSMQNVSSLVIYLTHTHPQSDPNLDISFRVAMGLVQHRSHRKTKIVHHHLFDLDLIWHTGLPM